MSITESDLITNGRAFKYCFELQIQKLQMQMPFPCDIYFVWKRKNNSLKSQKTFHCQTGQKDFLINDKMQFQTTCYLNTSQLPQKFQIRQSNLSVVIHHEQSPKNGGMYTLDLTSILNPINYRQTRSKYIQAELSKCPIKNSKIYLKLTAAYIHQMVPNSIKQSDRASVKSITSGFGRSYNTPNTYMLSSEYSISSQYQDQNYGFSQKICKSPSKEEFNKNGIQIAQRDTYSVTSYGYRQNNNHLRNFQDDSTKNQLNSHFSTTKTFAQNKDAKSSQNQNSKKENQSRNSIRSNIQPCNQANSNVQINQISQISNNYVYQRNNPYRLQIQKIQNSQNQNNQIQNSESNNGNGNMSPTVFKSTSKNKKWYEQNSKLTQRSCQSKYKQKLKQKDPSQLGSQLKQQQNKRSKIEAQLNKLNIMYNQRDKKLKEYVTQNYKLKEELKKIKQNVNNQSCASSQTKSQVSIYPQNSFEKVKKQYDLFKQKCASLEFDCSKYKQSLIKEQQLKDQLQKQNNEFKNKANQLQNQLNYHKQQLFNIRSASNNFNKLVEQLKIENQGLKNQKRSQKQLTKQLQQYKSHIESLKIQLDNQLKNSYKDRQNYTKQLRESFDKIQKYKIQILDKQKIIQSLKDNQQKVIKQIRELSCQIQTKNRKNTDLTFRIDDLQRKNNNLQTQKRIMLSDIDKFKYDLNSKIHQIQLLKQNTLNVKDDKISQFQQKNQILKDQNIKLLNYNQKLNFDIQQCMKDNRRLSESNFTLNKQIDDKKRDMFKIQIDNKRLRNIQPKLNQSNQNITKKEKQINDLRHQNQQHKKLIQQRQRQLTAIKNQLNQLKKKNQNNNNQIIQREKVQMEIHLKYIQQQNYRLKPYQQQYNQLKYQIQIYDKNKQQHLQTIQALQKELKDKNRAYILQVQKNKFISEEKNNQLKHLNQMREQLERFKKIVVNGDAQLRELDNINIQLDQQCRKKHSLIQKLQSQIKNYKNNQNNNATFKSQINQLQRKVQDLKYQNSEKMITIEKLNKTLIQQNQQMKQIKTSIDGKQQLLKNNQILINQLKEQIKTLQNLKNSLQKQFFTQTNQLKSFQRKNSILMQQLHSSKKRYEQQKVRSTSINNYRSSQDISRLRNLENQLTKKDQKIRKLQKQVIKLQDQNVQLNIKIMRQFSNTKNIPNYVTIKSIEGKNQ